MTQRRGDAEARRGAAKPAAIAFSLDFLCVSLHLCASASNQVTLQTVSQPAQVLLHKDRASALAAQPLLQRAGQQRQFGQPQPPEQQGVDGHAGRGDQGGEQQRLPEPCSRDIVK